ncbi:MAG: hypothetical protein L6R36_001681 [Xanthoria steineri]|nr:MAG: hypothetical protein L6R36_001681 [Xanthoria steineri]
MSEATVFVQPEPPFPFMLLPDELKENILANVKLDCPHTFLTLRLVHPWFNATISEVERLEIRLWSIEMKTSAPTKGCFCGGIEDHAPGSWWFRGPQEMLHRL